LFLKTLNNNVCTFLFRFLHRKRKYRKSIAETIYDFAQTTLSNLKQKSKEKKVFLFPFFVVDEKEY